jgi:hypothetical protein
MPQSAMLEYSRLLEFTKVETDTSVINGFGWLNVLARVLIGLPLVISFDRLEDNPFVDFTQRSRLKELGDGASAVLG